MKYWNKSKKYREQQWHRVKLAVDQPLEPALRVFYPVGMRSAYELSLSELKRWCQQQPSTGKFYYSPYTGWWFEKREDASWFILKWS